jgi:signal transduction histidine kinase
VGLVAVENLLTRRNFQRRQGQVRELLTYLQYAARALKNRMEFEQLYRQVEQRARDLAYLLKLTRELMQTHAPFEQVLQQTLRTALKALRGRAQMGSIYLYDSQTGELTIAADTGYSAQVREIARFRPGEGVAGYVYATGRPYVVKDTANDAHYRAIPGFDVNIRSTMGIPLSARQRRLGVLCLDNLKQTGAFDDESQRLMMIFANHIALWLERIRLIDQLRYKRDVAYLAADLVHEIKGVVAGISDLTREIEAALQNGQHASLIRCVDDLRSIATDTSNASKWLYHFAKTWRLRLETIDLNIVVDEVYQKMKKNLPSHIQFLLTLSSYLAIQCDRALIEILLENLIENAFEAIPPSQEGRVTLIVESDKRYGIVKVWNNGPSIPPEYQEEIWKPGWTTKDEDETAPRGLGLSLCRYIAQAHEGSLVLDSTITEGVTFVLRLPLRGPSWVEEIEDDTGETYFTS